MQPITMLALAGTLTAGLAAAGQALAAQSNTQPITFTPPPGTVAEITLSGSGPVEIAAVPISAVPVSAVPVSALPVAVPMPMPMPVMMMAPGMAGPDPFAALDRISAAMDAEGAAMMRAMDAMMAAPALSAPVPAAFGFTPNGLPVGGSASYTVISANSGAPGAGCMESVEILGQGPGKPPKILSRRAGQCGPAAAFGAVPAGLQTPAGAEALGRQAQPLQALPSAPAAPAPHLIRVRDTMPAMLPEPAHT